MLKDGFEACSTVTLEGVERARVSRVEGCTGGGGRGRPFCSSLPSSSRFTDSIMPRKERPGLVAACCGARAGCVSFCGGAGGSSTGAAPPSGPSGPISSSKDCSVVDCVPKRRGVRVLRPPGVFVGAGLGASLSRGTGASACSTSYQPVCIYISPNFASYRRTADESKQRVTGGLWSGYVRAHLIDLSVQLNGMKRGHLPTSPRRVVHGDIRFYRVTRQTYSNDSMV